MPVQIGAIVHNFTDPTGLLSDCHRRVEMFLGMLEAVAHKLEVPVTNQTKQMLESSLLYFSQAAPKHTADEEHSLFPRMRQIQHPEVLAAMETLAQLENDHRQAKPLHDRVEYLGRKFLAEGRLPSTEIDQFRQAIAGLLAMYRQHIRIEEDVVFPLAARMLSDDDKAAIAQEMASRRDVPLNPTAK